MEGITQKIKGIFSRSSHGFSYKKKDINPQRDWLILVGVFGALLLGMAGFSYEIYRKIEKGELFISDKISPGTTTTINMDLLKKVTEEISQKRETIEKIGKGEVTQPDPSI